MYRRFHMQVLLSIKINGNSSDLALVVIELKLRTNCLRGPEFES